MHHAAVEDAQNGGESGVVHALDAEGAGTIVEGRLQAQLPNARQVKEDGDNGDHDAVDGCAHGAAILARTQWIVDHNEAINGNNHGDPVSSEASGVSQDPHDGHEVATVIQDVLEIGGDWGEASIEDQKVNG